MSCIDGFQSIFLTNQRLRTKIEPCCRLSCRPTIISTTSPNCFRSCDALTLEMLREDTRGWWADTLAGGPDALNEGGEPPTANAEGLRRFLEADVLPWFEDRRKELANRPLIREQAFGESFDPDKLEPLGRYEVHLDRKFERTLAMLLRLKGLRLA